jgi:hypothetical protein
MLVLRPLVKAEGVSVVVKARGEKVEEEAEEVVAPRAATAGNPFFDIINKVCY